MSEIDHPTKRRRLLPQRTQPEQTHVPQSHYSTSPTLTITIPTQVVFTETPQDLVYSVLTGNKAFYTKQEVLFLMDKLTKMIIPKFEGEASYIG